MNSCYAAEQGASDEVIQTLPEMVVTAADLRPGEDNTCPICLNEMALGDVARQLRCQHIFHKQVSSDSIYVNEMRRNE